MTRLALLGTGLLGSGMVRRFIRNGNSVVVWNRTESKARALEAHGATVAASPREAVTGLDRVHLVLQDDAVVDAILDEIAPALKPGAIVIDHSTTLPETTAKRGERMRANGIRFLHAPVFMSPLMAENGTGFVLVSGPEKEYADVKTELDSMTGEVWYLGERPDLAANYKLYGNCMLFAISGGLADVISMARANGVDPVEAMSIFTKFQPGNIVAARGPKMARGEMTPTMFSIEMARKDVRLMTEAAKDRGLVVLPAIGKRMDDLIASGGAELDITAIGH
ncbi:MAG TPA: NAD(P)-dependent oxidoreductase [Vicinamibacterales bacterium]|nr:NAD(P)-dependent oxidoreductase [Vicinamibacterales bacterium]